MQSPGAQPLLENGAPPCLPSSIGAESPWAIGDAYTCYIGVLSETESDLDVDPLVFDEFYCAPSDFGQLVSQRLAVEIMAKMRARPPTQLG